MKKINKLYIYGLFDPRTSELRYVGKTNNIKSRLRKHMVDTANNHKCAWIKNLVKDGFMPDITILDEVSNDDWQFWEDWHIQYFKSIGCRLTNIRPGGVAGLEFTKKIRDKISHANKGRPKTEKSKRKLSEARKNPEWNKHISESLKGIKYNISPEVKNKLSKLRKEHRHSEETKRIISLSKIGKKRPEYTPEWRRNLGNATRGIPRTLEDRTKISNSKKKLTTHQVKRIHEQYQKDGLSAGDLAKEYKVTSHTIRNVLRGKFYKIPEAANAE